MRIRRVFLISWDFLNSERLFGKMVRQNDQRALDTYLALLRAYKPNTQASLPLDYDTLARDIGLGDWPKGDARRQINRTLRKLEHRYGLVEMRSTVGSSIPIVLKDYADPSKSYSLPQTRFLKIPPAYWDYGWSNSLSLPAKAILLLNFAYSPIDRNSRRWQASRYALVRKHHLSNWIVSRGTTELRRKNLLDMEYDALDQTGLAPKHPHVFLPQPLYNPKDLARKLKRLEEQHGAEKLERAKKLAALVYEDCDAGAMEKLIELEEKYGLSVMQQAAEIMAAKSPSNPKRSMGYLIGTIQGIGDKS